MAVLLFVLTSRSGILGNRAPCVSRRLFLSLHGAGDLHAAGLHRPTSGSTTGMLKRQGAEEVADGGALADRRAGPGEHLDRPPGRRREGAPDRSGRRAGHAQRARWTSSDATVEAILITHCHFDHVGAVAEMARRTRRPGLLPRGRGLHPRGHQRLRALPGLRAVRVLLAREDRQGRRQAAARRLRDRRHRHARPQPATT